VFTETYIAVDSTWKILDDPKRIKEQYLLQNVAAIQEISDHNQLAYYI